MSNLSVTFDTIPNENYLMVNINSFVNLVKTINWKHMVSPIFTIILSSMANINDSAHNNLNGKENVNYKSPGGFITPYYEHFTDDFWVMFLMSHMENEDPQKVIKLAKLFSVLAFMTPAGPKHFCESEAIITITYGDEEWCNTSLSNQGLTLFEQKNDIPDDDIRFNAYIDTLKECGNDKAIKKLFMDMIPEGFFDTLTFIL
jgi:hypothetical protein